MDRALTGDDIKKICKCDPNIMTYPELTQYDNVEDLLNKNGMCVILYLTGHNYGHWVCLFNNNEGHIEFFDSYGMKPDSELAFKDEHFREMNDQKYPHLTWLLLNSKRKVDYNNHKFQKMKNDISTCGKWVGMRLLCKDLSLTDFYDTFKKGVKNPDLYVSELTENLI